MAHFWKKFHAQGLFTLVAIWDSFVLQNIKKLSIFHNTTVYRRSQQQQHNYSLKWETWSSWEKTGVNNPVAFLIFQ